MSLVPNMPERPKLPAFRRVDDCIDAPYEGLEAEMQRGALSEREQKRLRFIRWGLRHNKGHFHEFILRAKQDLE